MSEASSTGSNTKRMATGRDEITDDEHWTEGDAVLVSSDNVRFRVHSYYLLAASSFFRDAQDLALGSLELPLTDPELESAYTLRYFLHLITKNVMDKGILHIKEGQLYVVDDLEDMYPGQRLLRLFRLLQKYGCDGHFARLKDWVTALAPEPSDAGARLPAFSIFMIGVELSDVKLCQYALARKNTQWDEPCYLPLEQAKHKVEIGVHQHHILNPAGMPLGLYEAIPSDYIFALTRAWVGREPDADVSDAFPKALRAVQRARSRKRKLPDPDEE